MTTYHDHDIVQSTPVSMNRMGRLKNIFDCCLNKSIIRILKINQNILFMDKSKRHPPPEIE